MHTFERKIDVAADIRVSSVWAVPEDYRPQAGTALILAHGAGNDMQHPFIRHVHEGLARKGLLTIRFNFPYKEQGRKAPDRAPLLEATWRAVIGAVRNDPALSPRRLVLAGKSLGGRIASHLAAQGEDCDALVFLGYPLHPANKPEKLRDQHLPDIMCPMLFIEGTRDPLCRLDLLQGVLKSLSAPVTLHLIEGGEHSFKLPKRMGRSEAAVWDEIVDTVGGWLQEVE